MTHISDIFMKNEKAAITQINHLKMDIEKMKNIKLENIKTKNKFKNEIKKYVKLQKMFK